MENITSKLEALSNPVNQYQVYTEDAKNFDFKKKQHKVLYIIVGVGADVLLDILRNIKPQSNETFLVFLKHKIE